ncbi:MAG TPA: FtsX-like permease family protein [Acidimicrobiales bacterium]|nr:FtsX-like permease family protein [Acidimicrobiales bacterium]
MGAVRLVFNAELRRRWRSWLAIALLVGVVGGLVLAAAAAGRRTENAFPRFVAAHGFDTIVYATRPVPAVAHIPGVASATELVLADAGNPTCDCGQINDNNFGVVVVSGGGASPFKLVSGQLPDPSMPDQVLASSTLQQSGVHVGTVFHVPFEAPSQAADYNNPNTGLPDPHGPHLALQVVGIEASEVEFPSGTAPVYFLYAGPGFTRSVLPHTALQYAYLVRLRRGAAGIPQFDEQANRLNLGMGSVGASSEDGTAATIQSSIHPQAVGWWILAALAALVGLAVVGQALARQSAVESQDNPTLVAVGMSGRELFAVHMARNLVVGLAGAVGAVVLATALSPIAPLGEARLAESSTGIEFDSLVLLLGALVTVAVVLALGIWPALRAARTRRMEEQAAASRSSAVVRHLVTLGAPPTAVIGVRNALERRSDGSAVPLGSALLGMVLAVIALCGTGVFGASLTNLTATPRLYGEPEQVSFSPPNPALLASLEHNRAVTAVTEGVGAGDVTVHGKIVGTLGATSVKGPLLFSTVAGDPPAGDDQIGLGVSTMHQLGASIGSVVDITFTTHSGAPHTEPFLVVSQVSFPQYGGFVSLGTGILMTTAGLVHVACLPGPQLALCRQKVAGIGTGGVRVSFVPGPRGKAALDRYLAAYPSITSKPLAPTSLVNFGEAVNFPLIFGVMLAVFGAATLAHLLVVSVSRRRREVGLLKVLGFVNRQVVSTVSWQATTLALVGVVVGVPLGLVVGRTVWNTFANNLGVVPVAVVPVLLTAAITAGVLVSANVIAIAPALIATRSKPGDLLRPLD